MSKKTLTIALLLSVSPLSAVGSEISIGIGNGEFENEVTTHQTFIDVRQDIGDHPVYVLARYEDNAHPIADIDDASVMIGGGMHFQGALEAMALEIAGDQDKYLAHLYYTNEHGPLEFRGGLYHSNLYDQGFKRTSLKLSSGYRLTDALHLGAFYQVGNTTKKSVDDLWGGYLKWVY